MWVCTSTLDLAPHAPQAVLSTYFLRDPQQCLSFPELPPLSPSQTRVGRATPASDIGLSAIGPREAKPGQGSVVSAFPGSLLKMQDPDPPQGWQIHNLILEGPQVTHIHGPAWKAQMIGTLANERAKSCPHLPRSFLGMSACETNQNPLRQLESGDSLATEEIRTLKHVCTP